MGAGRKVFTYEQDTKAAAQSSQIGFEQRQRNLGENLGGCIFGCNNETQQECLEGQIFGLPRAHWVYVQWITKGMPIFLFNYQSRKLHGIFQADSDGQWEINPSGWCHGSGTKTAFPAQVRVNTYKDCEPLTERDYRPILAQCYVEQNHLTFELKRTEAQALCRLFDEKTNKLRKGSSSIQDQRPMPSATSASSALALGKKAFRPASPPVVSAWGASASASEPESKPEPKRQKPPPEPSDFPGLGGDRPAANGRVEEPRAQSTGSEPADSGASSWKPPSPWDAGMLQVELPTEDLPAARVEQTPEPPTKRHATADVPTRENADGWDGWDEPSPPEGKKQAKQLAQQPIMQQNQSVASGGKAQTQPPVSTVSSQKSAEVQQPHSGGAQEAARVGNGAAQAGSEYETAMEAVHRAVMKFDKTSADALKQLFEHVRGRLERATEDRIVLAQVADIFKTEKEALEETVAQQTDAIEALKQETAALRRDLAFVGSHVDITVAPVNTAIRDLPPIRRRQLRQPEPEPQQQAQAAGSSSRELGVAPSRQSMILFGGNNMEDWIDTMDIFAPSARRWVSFGQMPSKRGYSAAAALPGHVFLIGGGSGSAWNADCLRFDVPTNEWFQMAPMDGVRGNLSAVALDGRIYAIGGGESGKQTNRVEILDPDLNQWLPGKAMRGKRFGTAAEVVDGTIVVAGGFDGDHYLATAERHDPRTGFWETLPEFENRRGGHQAVAVGSDVHLLAGWDGTEFLDTVEIYDSRKNAWRGGARMKTCRAYFGAAELDGQLFALGGLETKTSANTAVEQYEASIGKWLMYGLEEGDKRESHRRIFGTPCRIEV